MLQVSLPEIDGAVEPFIYAGREGARGRSIPLADRVNLLADRALKWSNLRIKLTDEKKISITISISHLKKVILVQLIT